MTFQRTFHVRFQSLYIKKILFKLYPLTVHSVKKSSKSPLKLLISFPMCLQNKEEKQTRDYLRKLARKKHPQKSNCVSNSEPEPIGNKTQLRYLLSIKLNQPKPIFKIRIQRGTHSLWKKNFQITTNVPVKQRIQQIINHVSRLYHATLIQNQIAFLNHTYKSVFLKSYRSSTFIQFSPISFKTPCLVSEKERRIARDLALKTVKQSQPILQRAASHLLL